LEREAERERTPTRLAVGIIDRRDTSSPEKHTNEEADIQACNQGEISERNLEGP
jgi:hypothetical protein